MFQEKPKTHQITTGRWLHILPDTGKGHLLYDALDGQEAGRILFDPAGNWIYDGNILGIDEQEELAGAICGYQREMENLLIDVKNGLR